MHSGIKLNIILLIYFLACFLGALVEAAKPFFAPAIAEAAEWNISTWAPSTDEWREKLSVNYRRSGCTRSPAECLESVKRAVARDHVKKYFLSIYSLKTDPKAENLKKDALLYSQLSLKVKELEEIGIDDFVYKFRQFSKQLSNPAMAVNEIIDNTKKLNPNLKFGITLYVEQLDSSELDDAQLPPNIRKKIDYVHLYIHFRKDGPKYAAYVEKAKIVFPRAKIIAGVYAFDRIDYLRCSQHDLFKRKCTSEEEIGLFKKALEIQARLLRDGKIEAIEFYPGYFGMEEKTIARHGKCNPERRKECLQNTKEMSAAALEILNRYKTAAGR